MAKQTVTKRNKSNLPSWVKGTILSLAISASLLFALPFLVLNGLIGMGTIPYLCLAIHVASVFIGAYIAGRSQQGNKLVICAFVFGTYLIFLFGISIIFFDGLSGAILGGVVSSGIGMICAAFIASGKNKALKGKRRRTIS